MAELEKSYEGPVRGLEIAPEFYKLLQSPELKGTPIARAFGLQNQILGEISASLGGSAFGGRKGGKQGAGALPPDMVSAIGEQVGSQLSSRGIEGSPAGAIAAAMRMSGASEQIRSQRISQGLGAIQALGGASILPSASQSQQVGANVASQRANLEQDTAARIMGAKAENRSQTYGAIGTAAALVAAPFTGGASLALAGGLGSMMGGGGGGGYAGAQPMGGVNYGAFQDTSMQGQAMGANSNFYGDPYAQQLRRQQLDSYWGQMPTY